MNKSLATFLKIAVTVAAIGTFLFGIAYTMTGDQSNTYKTDITNAHSKLPTIP